LTQSPSSSALANGRLRFPSASTPNSAAKSWSAGGKNVARRLIEDEREARRERERRRKASVALGGEEERDTAAEEEAKKVEESKEKEQGKLKFADFEKVSLTLAPVSRSTRL
jgi:hypothetical protein